jgi:hypothetical protein
VPPQQPPLIKKTSAVSSLAARRTRSSSRSARAVVPAHAARGVTSMDECRGHRDDDPPAVAPVAAAFQARARRRSDLAPDSRASFSSNAPTTKSITETSDLTQ